MANFSSPAFGPFAEIERRNNLKNNPKSQNTNGPSAWEKFVLGNFAYDEYPNPTKVDTQWYPDLLPPEVQAQQAAQRSYMRQLQNPSGMPIPGWGPTPRVYTPTELQELYSRGSQSRGSNRPSFMDENIPRTINPVNAEPTPSQPSQGRTSANAGYIPGFDEGDPGPGYSAVPAARSTLWDRFRAATAANGRRQEYSNPFDESADPNNYRSSRR